MRGSQRVAAAVLLVLLVAVTGARADGPRRTTGPQPPPAVAPPSAIARLAGGGQRMAIYVQPRSPSCESLLRLLEAKPAIASSAKLSVIVAGASAGDLERMKQKHSGLSAASWTADPSRSVFKELDLPGVPVVLGLRDGKVEWSLRGILPDAGALDAILSGWLAGP